jgi:hypothetical protein
MSNPAADQTPPASAARHVLYNNYVIGGMIVVVTATIYYLSTLIERVPPGLAQGIQPASFPQGVLVAILGLLAMMLFETREHVVEIPEPIPALAYKTMIAMVASLAAATLFDFFAGLIAFVVVCVPLWGMRRIGLALGYALALHAVLFLLFSTLLKVRFPMGPLTRLLY